MSKRDELTAALIVLDEMKKDPTARQLYDRCLARGVQLMNDGQPLAPSKSKVVVDERSPNGDDGLGWGEKYWFVKIGEEVVDTRRSKKSADDFADLLRTLEGPDPRELVRAIIAAYTDRPGRNEVPMSEVDEAIKRTKER